MNSSYLIHGSSRLRRSGARVPDRSQQRCRVALDDCGHRWQNLPRLPGLFARLALLNQNYHEFASAESVFRHLERANLLDHRVGRPIPPGSEPEPFVPQTSTRAAARARFLKAHAGEQNLQITWNRVDDPYNGRRWLLDDPFAERFVQTTTTPGPTAGNRAPASLLDQMVEMAEAMRQLRARSSG